MKEQGQKRRGCLFYTLLVVGISVLVLIVASYAGYRYAKGLIAQFTDTEPMPVPVVQMSQPEMNRLRDRIERFSSAVEEGKPTEPLSVTADEVNGMINSNPDLVSVKGHLHFGIEGDEIRAQLSIPAEELGLKPLKGRYVNATGAFKVVLKDGVLEVTAQSLSAKGRPMPEPIMRHIRPQNFAFKLNQEPDVTNALGKLAEIQIRDGKIVIVPKK